MGQILLGGFDSGLLDAQVLLLVESDVTGGVLVAQRGQRATCDKAGSRSKSVVGEYGDDRQETEEEGVRERERESGMCNRASERETRHATNKGRKAKKCDMQQKHTNAAKYGGT